MEFTEYFESNRLSGEEKDWSLNQVHSSIELQSLVLNTLLSLNLVTASEIQPYRLDSPDIHWKCAFDSGQDRVGYFLSSEDRQLGVRRDKRDRMISALF